MSSSESERRTNLRAMHCFVATGTPASSSRERTRVVLPANIDFPRRELFLEMAAQTKIGVPGGEQFRIHRSVRAMAYRAAFAGGLMLEHERSTLGSMALEAGFIFGGDHRATASNCRPFVRIMTIVAAYFVFQHRMMRSQLELTVLIEVALETSLG